MTLKKINVQPIQMMEEMNMFKNDGSIMHFRVPKVHASLPANMFVVYGHGEEKQLADLVPDILNQLGPDSLASLRKLAESYQIQQNASGEDIAQDGDNDDLEIPNLVPGTSFESAAEVE